MNFECENISLIDISLEDDFLIDSCLDNLSLDLRLSVACETQNELVSSLGHAKLRAHPNMNNAEPLFAMTEQESAHVEREHFNKRCSNSLRKSLAWDHAFFTSPGFLELEELCLVNKGFKNPEVSLICETQEHTRSKICKERNSSHEQGVGVAGRQKTQSLMKPKLTSLNKVNSPLGCKLKSPSVLKTQVVENTTKRRESLKSTRTMEHTKVLTVDTQKPPLKTVSKSIVAAERHGMTARRRADSLSVSSVSSSQSGVSLISASNSLDLTLYTTCASDSSTASLWSSQGIEGDCFYDLSLPTSGDSQSTGDIEASEGHQNDQQCHQSPLNQGNLGKDLLNQHAARATRNLLSADVHQSSKPSSLRLPSQKIGFFDVVSRMPTSNDHTQPKDRLKNTKPKQVSQPSLSKTVVPNETAVVSHDKCGSKTSSLGPRRRSQPHFERQKDFSQTEEKENMFHPKDTMIELKIKSSLSPSPSPSPSPSKSVANGSSSSGKHLSKAKQSMRQTMLGSAGTRIPLSTKGSPLKRSAFF